MGDSRLTVNFDTWGSVEMYSTATVVGKSSNTYSFGVVAPNSWYPQSGHEPSYQLIVTTQGYVGIATGTPSYLLDVNGTARINGVIISSDALTTAALQNGASTQVSLAAGHARESMEYSSDLNAQAAYASNASNYFGDGSDGDVTVSADTQLTVPNKNGSYDGDMVVKNYNTLTINSGAALTTDQPGRGLLVYVKGNCVINGTLTMTARGAAANPTAAGGSDNAAVSATGIRIPAIKSGGSDALSAADFSGCGNGAKAAVANQPGISGNGTIYTISRAGAAGGAAVTASHTNGNPGNNGSAGQAGGGGSGCTSDLASSDAGAAGTCFSGGPGAGSQQHGGCTASVAPVANGGQGGKSGIYCNATIYNGGGAGNPGGTGGQGGSAGNSGTGGLLMLIVGGSLSGSGTVSANGSAGGNASGASSRNFAGSGAGGGNILILYAGTEGSSWTTQANGGAGGTASGGSDENRSGAAGGTGSVQKAQISASVLQAYSSGAADKTQGSYSLKATATTAALNKTLTKTFATNVNLAGAGTLKFDIRSSRTGSNIKIGIHDTGGTTTETTPNITSADAWQTVSWDISGVSDANKDAIDKLIITIVNADADNTFYIDNMHASSGTVNDITFTTSGTERMRIDSMGNVGIGTADTESYRLRVSGGSAAVDTGQSWTTASDIRLKKDVSDLGPTLSKVAELRGVRYHAKDEKTSDGLHIGFVAQELEKYFPEVVLTGADGYKGIDYGRISAILLEAVKDQQRQIEELKNANERLSSENKSLDLRLSAVERK